MNKQKGLALISHLTYDTTYNYGDVNSDMIEALTELTRLLSADTSIIDAASEVYAMLDRLHYESRLVYGEDYDDVEELLTKARGDIL